MITPQCSHTVSRCRQW